MDARLCLLLAKHLGFLLDMVKHGSEEIWAIVQHERQWAEQIKADLLWLKSFSNVEWLQVDAHSWPEWWHILLGR